MIIKTVRSKSISELDSSAQLIRLIREISELEAQSPSSQPRQIEIPSSPSFTTFSKRFELSLTKLGMRWESWSVLFYNWQWAAMYGVSWKSLISCSRSSFLFHIKQDRFTTCFKTCGTKLWVFRKVQKKVQKTVQTFKEIFHRCGASGAVIMKLCPVKIHMHFICRNLLWHIQANFIFVNSWNVMVKSAEETIVLGTSFPKQVYTK